MKTLVSSAKRILKNRLDALESFMYKIYNRGPNIDPWGTLCIMLPVFDVVLLYFFKHIACDFESNFKTMHKHYLLVHMHVFFYNIP